MSDPTGGFELVDVRHIASAAFLEIEEMQLTSPNGVAVQRVVVRHPGAVAIVPVVGQEVVLIRQYRAPIDRSILEIPAGKLDVPDEDREVAARRELEEEVGLRAASLQLIASIWTAPGFADERIWIYLADDVTEVAARPHGAEEEVAEIVRIPIANLPSMLAADEFEDAKTVVGLSAMLSRLT